MKLTASEFQSSPHSFLLRRTSYFENIFLGADAVNCLVGNGNSYTGTVAVTQNGVTCQRWDAQTPHDHTSASDAQYFPDATLSDASNFCRNPTDGDDATLWCYTTDPNTRWDYCSITSCGK